MQKYLKEFIKTTNRKGLLETIAHLSKLILAKLWSVLRISFLRLREYNIDFRVLLRGSVNFFQSTKKAINISSNVTLGKGLRISAGGNGKIFIEKNTLIDDFTFVMAHEKIEIKEGATIASFCFITDFNHRYQKKNMSVLKQEYETKPVVIGRNTWIGTHCIILPGVKIGDGSVVGAGSIVTKSIPENSVAVGNPAKVIRKIKRN